MSALNFEVPLATLTKIDVRKQQDGDDQEVEALHMTFKGLVSASVLKECFGLEEIPDHLWRDNDDHDPFALNMGQFAIKGQFDDHECKFAKMELKPVRISAIKGELKPHKKLELTFKVTKLSPTDKQHTGCVHRLKHENTVKIESDPDLFYEQMEDNGEDEAGSEEQEAA